MRRLAPLLFVIAAGAAASGLAACGGAPGLDRATATPTDTGEAVRRFAEAEDRALGALAASDPRLAARLGVAPGDDAGRAAMQALLVGDEAAPLEGGSLDVFSFGTRQRMLRAVADDVGRTDAALPEAASGSIAMPRLERELLVRLVDAEEARLARELIPGRGTAALLASLADAWSPPRDEADARARGQSLARRFDELRDAVAKAKLTLLERDAIDDALDPLERLTLGAGMNDAAARLAALRVELGAANTVGPHATPAPELGRALRVALGAAATGPELHAALVGAKASLETSIARAMAPRSKDDRAFVLTQAAMLQREPASCPRPATGSRLRAAAPPPERAAMRGIACILHSTRDEPTAALAATVAAHDLVIVALWATEVHVRGVDPYRAESTHRPLAAVTPEWATRRLRAAVADPASAIGAGMAVELLVREGPQHVAERAAAWVAFGDAPLDVVAARAVALRR